MPIYGILEALAGYRVGVGDPETALRALVVEDGLPHHRISLAFMALDRGDTGAAVELLERRLREARTLARVPALELLARAQTARGAMDEAAAHVAALREVEQLVGTPAVRACADRAEGVLALARGDRDRGRQLLEDALGRFEATGGAYEVTQTRLALAPPLDGITPRERDVLRLVAEGLTNQQIAERLVVSEHTVHRHVTNILRKLDLPSRAAAAAHAVRAGI